MTTSLQTGGKTTTTSTLWASWSEYCVASGTKIQLLPSTGRFVLGHCLANGLIMEDL